MKTVPPSDSVRNRKLNLTGQRFGRLVVLTSDRTRRGTSAWRCRCDCGNETVVATGNLRNGNTSSCGCLRLERLRDKITTHGMVKTRTYVAWQNMRKRCEDPSNRYWPDYGGRGIRVCERWSSFEAFLADMGECPDGLTIDRIDVDGDYESSNCRWATQQQQQRNKRNTRYLTYQQKTQSLADWADEMGVNYYTLHWRVRRGWSDEQVLRTPVKGVERHG